MREKELMQQVLQLAHLRGWLCYHTHDSRHSAKGYPDLTLVRGKRLVFMELKTDAGKTTVEQDDWIDCLRAAGQEVYLLRPSQWSDIERILE